MMHFLCLLLTCFCLCGCIFQPSQSHAQQQPAIIKTEAVEKRDVELKDPQPEQKGYGWPVTICICAAFLFMPLFARRRIN